MELSSEPRPPPAPESPEDAVLLGRRFRQTLENVSMIALALDLEGRVTFANDFLLDLTGWSREDVVGHDWFERFVPDADADVVRQVFRTDLSSHDFPAHYENEIVTRSGRRRLIAWSNSVLLGDDGQLEGTVSLGADVTEEREAAAVLSKREELFRSLIEHTSDVIGILAPDGTVLYASPSVERLLAWTPDEILHTRSFALVHEDDVALVEQTFNEILLGEEPGPTEFRIRHRDGSWRTVEGVGRRRQEAGGWVVVVNYRDVTDQRQLREQLTHGQKLEAVGRLAGGIAHDFNNLLTAIRGYSDFLAAGFDEGDPRLADALEIVHAADRATALTGQLLAFSRRQVLQQEVLDLGELITTLEKLLSRLLGENVELVTTVQPGCYVRADRGQLEQVVANLVVNARDAMPSGGRLEISTRVVDGQAVLLVGDTGTGMSPDTLSHLFEPFFTTKGPGKGTGLGLATVYGIVAQSGGTVSVTSELGAGTIFRVQLPLSDEEPHRHEGTKPSRRQGGTECVLVAEDEETIRRLVTEVLTRDGYSVHAAASGAEALALLDEHGPAIDLLLTDVVMPGMSGPELARAARLKHPTLRVVFTSGYSEPDEAFEDPNVAFIEKPFSPQALVARVRDALDAPD